MQQPKLLLACRSRRAPLAQAALLALAVMFSFTAPARSASVVEVLPVHERLLMVHLSEGHVEHHTLGMPRGDEKVIISPLDVAAASKTSAYRITSSDDPVFAQGLSPVRVGRKSMGSDFAWFIDAFVGGKAVNNRPDHVKDHWLYLLLPAPLQADKTYSIDLGSLIKDQPDAKSKLTFRFGNSALRSEAVHVNQLGYVPDAPEKFGYVYHWAGDLGGIDFMAWEGRAFRLIDAKSGATAFTGRLAFRKPASQPETYHAGNSPPVGNYLGAPVWECDFSSFNTPGQYRLIVEGIGASFPFTISPDAYRPAFRATARALYHNRSGIALEEPYTHFTRPAPHNPKLTPGFAGRLQYTTVRYTEWGSEGGDRKLLESNFKGPIDSAGWYQDAGDWDSYVTHLRVAQELLLAYDLAPSNFRDNENNIPESGNRIPDILDEAAWLPRFCHRLRHELLDKKYGSGGIGLRIAGDAFGGDEKRLPDGSNVAQGSWQDVDRTWAASGEDPWSTYRYAGAAAQLALSFQALKTADPQGVDWRKEAIESYAWAAANTRDGDEQKDQTLRAHRAYAAASLFRLTQDKAYEAQLAKDTAHLEPNSLVWEDERYGIYVYVLAPASLPADPALRDKLRSIALATSDAEVDTAQKRALRWAGNWYMPMLIGQQTTPWAIDLAVGYRLARTSEPDRAKRYLATLYTTTDYFLGANSQNRVTMTGVGQRSIKEIFHMDAWYNGGPGKPSKGYQEGLIPYSPWLKQTDEGNGPWDVAWAHKTLYPSIDNWPGNERFFPNRGSPMGSEFTVHQNTGPAAAFFGVVSGSGLESDEGR